LTTSADVRARLGHPVIDSDGHWIEFPPVFSEFLRKIVGEDGVKRFWKAQSSASTLTGEDLDWEGRSAARLPGLGWWGMPTKPTADRAAVMISELLYKRLSDFGLDFAVVFPTSPSLTQVGHLEDDELRRAGARAHNDYAWDMFRGYTDRLTPVAIIPNHTPTEAIAELEYVHSLGFKAVCFAGLVSRPMAGAQGRYWDALALDSDYDYDPVWSKLQELGLAGTFHTSTMYFGYRSQRSSFTYNHIGHFAAGAEALCKAFFLGGVPKRFPKLRIAFMEGGAGWAVNLYNDLVRHWKTRNPDALQYLDPDNLDRDQLKALMKAFGTPTMRTVVNGAALETGRLFGSAPPPDKRDDFRHAGIQRVEQIRDQFVNSFYFGSEGEDPLVGTAFNRRVNACQAKLSMLLGSDIGHFDVLDMNGVLAEAYEQVEHGVLDENEFREFSFENAARFWTSHNPDFFKGTVVEREVKNLLNS